MKKLLTMLLAILMVLSLFGCALIISMAVVNFLYHRNEERKAAAQ